MANETQKVDPDDALVTYRSLRIAMVAATAMLAASIVALGAHNHWHFEGSISAYYYTVAHSVFIAAVCALGICLIAYKGHSPTEDTCWTWRASWPSWWRSCRPRVSTSSTRSCPPS
jgi:hypothetical protein